MHLIKSVTEHLGLKCRRPRHPLHLCLTQASTSQELPLRRCTRPCACAQGLQKLHIQMCEDHQKLRRLTQYIYPLLDEAWR